MANFALNYSFSRNLNIPLDEDAVKSTYAEVLTYVQTKSKCYAGQLFSVVSDGDNNGLYLAVTTGENAVVVKLATQEALEAVAASAGKIDKIKLNGTELTIEDKTVNIDLSTYSTVEYVDDSIEALKDVYAPKAEFEELQGKVEDITSTGGEPNVQSDWNTIDTEADSFIKNKPDLTVYAIASAVTEDIADAVEEAKGYTDDEVAKVATKVNTLIGEDAEKSARAIAAEEVAKVVANADADFDTLKEIADWIANDATGAASMANDIAALKKEDENLDGRLDALEGVKHSHSNKEVLDGISETKVNAWDNAAEKVHEHDNKAVLDGISADKVAAWDAAEQNAKTHAETKASEAQSAAESKAAELASAAETAAKTHAETKASEAQAAAEAKAAELASAAETAAKSHAEAKASEAATAAQKYADGLAVNYDEAGAAAQALADAKAHADGLAVNYDKAGAAETALVAAKAHVSTELGKLSEVYDAKGAAEAAETAAKAYADGLAGNYDAAGAAATAEQNAKEYADGLAGNYDAAGAAASAANTALENAKLYTDDEIKKLPEVYDAKGAAASAETAAKKYTDDKLVDYATQSFVSEQIVSALTNGTVDITGYAKIEEVKGHVSSAKTEAIAEASAYTDSEIAKLSNVYASKTVVETLVGEDAEKSARAIAAEEVAKVVASAPEAFDTLKEIADWIGNESGSTAADIVTDIAGLKAADELIDGRIDALEAISGQSHIHLNKEVLDGISAEKVAAWDAAEQNAKDYADGLADNYDVKGAAASAETAAKAYADGLVENIKPYEGGVATSIEMKEGEDTYTVDVKVSDDEKNFLKVNESNELEVKEITLDVAKTSKDITVEGGAWESIVKPIFGNTVPSGTTWESFLEAMLCVEKWAGTIKSATTFTVSCGNINPGLSTTGTVEVGTKITLNETKANTTTANQSITVSAFTYGYKIGENGERTTATAYTETLTPSKTKADDSLKITFTGFTNAVNGGSVIETKTGNGVIAAVTMYAMSGTNKVLVAQTGDTYAASTAVTADTIYISTNLKNYYKTDKTTPNTYTVTYPATSKTASDTTEYTVTGKFKYFIGDIVDYTEDYWNTDRSETVRGLKTSGWTDGSQTISNVAHEFKVGTKQQTVVVPSNYTSVSGKDVNNGDVTFNLVKTFDFTNAQGYISSYKVFVAPALDGLGSDSKITITIK